MGFFLIWLWPLFSTKCEEPPDQAKDYKYIPRLDSACYTQLVCNMMWLLSMGQIMTRRYRDPLCPIYSSSENIVLKCGRFLCGLVDSFSVFCKDQCHICLGRLRKPNEKAIHISRLLAKIQTRDLLNTKRICWRTSSLHSLLTLFLNSF
jgi:hypothetical protein